jgi:hypothetical protein
MRKHLLNKEERERAEALNAGVLLLKSVYDDCLYDLRRFFDEAQGLLKYLDIKTEFYANNDSFFYNRELVQRVKTMDEMMLMYVTEAQRMETKLHLFSMQYARLVHHLKNTANHYGRSAIFADLESETDNVLVAVIGLKEDIELLCIDFKYVQKEAFLQDAN